MKTGTKGGSLSVLSDDELERIYQASLSLLENPGIYSESDLFLDICEKGGARVDRDQRSIHIDKEMVEAAIASAPSSFILYGRNDPEMDLQIEVGRVYFGMGGRLS